MAYQDLPLNPPASPDTDGSRPPGEASPVRPSSLARQTSASADEDSVLPRTDISSPPPRAVEPASAVLEFDDPSLANALFGPQNSHLNLLADLTGLRLGSRGANLSLSGAPEDLDRACNLLRQMYGLLKTGARLADRDYAHAWNALGQSPSLDLKKLYQEGAIVPSPRKAVIPKTLGQREYVEALRTTDMTFAVGPAGTGKTYLAVAVALSMLLGRRVKRLVLTRPAVEAGERLGFLPGDMAEKVNPYLRPLFDALHDMLEPERVAEMIDSGVIEIAPLAFMRGRTLNDAFIILDEAQNTTIEQMKMFLTRLGFGSRAAITGDLTQIDLPDVGGRQRSGLIHALEVLKGVPGIRILRFQKEDVVRHPLVGRIVEAYDTHASHSR